MRIRPQLSVGIHPVRFVGHLKRKLGPLVSRFSLITPPLDCLYNRQSPPSRRASRPPRNTLSAFDPTPRQNPSAYASEPCPAPRNRGPLILILPISHILCTSRRRQISLEFSPAQFSMVRPKHPHLHVRPSALTSFQGPYSYHSFYVWLRCLFPSIAEGRVSGGDSYPHRCHLPDIRKIAYNAFQAAELYHKVP